MKFLGWMHRKLMHTGADEPTRKSKLGSPCLSQKTLFDQQHYYCIVPNKSSHSNIQLPKSQESFEPLPFDFLAIGTFGAELANTEDPPTPKLPTTWEKLSTNKATDNHPEVMSYKLDKFLEAEDEQEIARSSQASIITLSGKPTEEAADTVVKPSSALQNSVFLKPGEYKQAAAEERISLEDLFKRKLEVAKDDYCAGNYNEVAEQVPRKTRPNNLMKKAVNKFHCSSATTAASKSRAAAFSIKKKLFKALKMFRKQVHPEEMPEDNNNRNMNIGGNDVASKEKDKTTKQCSNNSCKSWVTNTGARGHWVKTDSDCKLRCLFYDMDHTYYHHECMHTVGNPIRTN
ncbi:protein LAZY 1-like isoform X2 [Andrographis paniculata]|uniref:protein LAZY 1-like isoform X2 n=1 Tax=Andrographis paniculata TaxID=175694 RepID=UPI0021E77BB2|nr:protein LAZY 1-like isoform X2 [Andrographis paniculata]